MPSVVDICNEALSHIGVTPIQTLEEDSDAARACKALYPSTVIVWFWSTIIKL